MECGFCKTESAIIGERLTLYIDTRGVLCIGYEPEDCWYGFDFDTNWKHCPYCGKKLR